MRLYTAPVLQLPDTPLVRDAGETPAGVSPPPQRHSDVDGDRMSKEFLQACIPLEGKKKNMFGPFSGAQHGSDRTVPDAAQGSKDFRC